LRRAGRYAGRMTGKVAAAYEARVAAGALQSDPAQLAVLPRLEAIRRAVEAPRPNGFLSLFAKPAEPVKGLYLWGGVGRGKSMLMDLFAETVAAPKRRVHFQAFMQ
jgi:cell division protein ZapE